MKAGYTAEDYANPSMLDALDGVGPYTPDEVVQLHAGFTLKRRRSTHVRRSLAMVLRTDPVVWASVLVMVGCAVVAGWVVLTKAGVL